MGRRRGRYPASPCFSVLGCFLLPFFFAFRCSVLFGVCFGLCPLLTYFFVARSIPPVPGPAGMRVLRVRGRPATTAMAEDTGPPRRYKARRRQPKRRTDARAAAIPVADPLPASRRVGHESTHTDAQALLTHARAAVGLLAAGAGGGTRGVTIMDVVLDWRAVWGRDAPAPARADTGCANAEFAALAVHAYACASGRGRGRKEAPGTQRWHGLGQAHPYRNRVYVNVGDGAAGDVMHDAGAGMGGLGRRGGGSGFPESGERSTAQW